MHLVYGLVDPRNGELFYVGRSLRGWQRATRHTRLRETAPGPKARLADIAAAGLAVQIWPLAWCATERECAAVETQIIRQWSRAGVPLTNRLNNRWAA